MGPISYLPSNMILITGGNGVIGAQLALKLQSRGEKVRILGIEPGNYDRDLLQTGVEIRFGDVTRRKDCEAAMTDIDIVYHLAAVLSSPENPLKFHSVNVGGTQAILAAAERNKVRHFIFISSISVIYPRRNVYSASKAEAEEWVKRSPFPWTVARPCLVLDGLEYRAFAAAVLRSPVLLLPRRGAARKRPIDLEDLAKALTKLAGNDKVMGKTIALGGKEIVSLHNMAEAILRARGLDKPVWPIPEILLRTAATLTELLSRTFQRKISWLSHQSIDGLVYDAAPEICEE